MLAQTSGLSFVTTRAMWMSKDVLGKEVIDSAGFKAGRVRDLAVRFADGKVQMAGIIVHNRFVPWSVVKSFGSDFYLDTRWFALGTQPIPGDVHLVGQHILGERLVDSTGRHVGHVDDISMEWDATSKELHFNSVLTGPYLSIGMSKGSQQIPWKNVIGIKHKPVALVIRRE